jgi:hypothetical protein
MAKQPLILRILDWKVIDTENGRFFRPFVRWSDFSDRRRHPELARVPDLAMRSRIRKCARRKSDTLGTRLRGIVVQMAFAGLVMPAGWIIQEYWKPTTPRQAMPIVFALLALTYLLLGIGFWVAGRVTDKQYRRALRIELTSAGFPTCQQCGYDLTGNLSGICPECGTAMAAKQCAAATTGESSRD